MQNSKKYSIIVFLTLSLVAGIFSNIPSLYAQGVNQTQTTEQHNATETGDHQAYEKKEHGEASSVRDSVAILLQDRLIPGGDFIHLYDSTPYHILNGHVALKAPCEDDSTTPIQVLIGSAPNMTVAELENIAPLSTPGEQCLYHVDLIPNGNVTVLTDIALKNSGDEDIEFPPTSTVVIGINEVKKGEDHEHAEDTEELGANSTATITAEDVE
jgi:hypothetical protein